MLCRVLLLHFPPFPEPTRASGSLRQTSLVDMAQIIPWTWPSASPRTYLNIKILDIISNESSIPPWHSLLYKIITATREMVPAVIKTEKRVDPDIYRAMN